MTPSSGPASSRRPNVRPRLSRSGRYSANAGSSVLVLLDLVQQQHSALGQACVVQRATTPGRSGRWASSRRAKMTFGRSERERSDEHVVVDRTDAGRASRRATFQERTDRSRPTVRSDGGCAHETGRIARPATEVEREPGRAWSGTFEEPTRGGLEHAREQIEPVTGRGAVLGVVMLRHEVEP